MTYRLCIALINAGKTDGLADKVDVFYAAGRLSATEYSDIIQRLAEGTA